MTRLAELRLSLAQAQIDLRATKDTYEAARATAEAEAIDSGRAGGTNEKARERALSIALLGDRIYCAALQYLRDAEAEVDRLRAELACEEDAIRANETRIREKLADALMSRRAEDVAADSGANTSD